MGHLHITISNEKCWPVEGGGCEAKFSFHGNLTEKGKRKSTMVLRVVLEVPGEYRVSEFNSGEIHGEYTGDYEEEYYIPANGVLFFYLDVWVGGKRTISSGTVSASKDIASSSDRGAYGPCRLCT
jgi:hypothetical protein